MNMETLYDIGSGDLKELWDSDLDPAMQEALKLSSDTDMHDWLLERDVKMPQVILHDKLMTDALLGTLPIKTEHSYSLNSDGDSMPDSPGSLQNKMEDMEEDCYPTVMTIPNGTSSSRQHNTNTNNNNHYHRQSHNTVHISHSIQSICSNNSSTNDNSSISSSDIDVDDSNVKDEPLSPGSSCPPSPCSNSSSNSTPNYGVNVNFAKMAAYTNADLVFEHKNGSLQLSPASQSLLKTQHIIIGSTQPQQQQPQQQQQNPQQTQSHQQQQQSLQQQSTQQQQQQQRIVIPKLNIKMEPQISTFGLPPTPPSSLSSDDSEGNQSPEHHISPMSPPANHQSSSVASSSSRRSSSMQSNSSNCSSNSPNSASNRGYVGTSSRQPIHTPLISSQPKGSTGSLLLTEEEKRTLQAEGYPIPTRLPLTKAEEKSLKKIRRKIKNKISAQESRRKKKEYMDQLERKVEILVSERNNYQNSNLNYQKRVETLEQTNANYQKRLEALEIANSNLTSQLSKYQAVFKKMKQ